jgi:glycosyltransferase involved in cell wall biosynthesis
MSDRGLENQPSTKSLRFVYLAPRDVLVARVARKCMMQLCEALNSDGAEVELISLRIRTMKTEPTHTRSIWDVYGIERRFRLTMVPTLFRQEHMGSRFAEKAILFYRLAVYPAYALVAWLRNGPSGARPDRTVFYSRNYGCIVGVLPLRKLLGNRARTILEVHVPPKSRLQRRVLKMVDGVACNGLSLHGLLLESGVVSESRSIGRHAGVSSQRMERTGLSRDQARRRLGWPDSDQIACYTGKVVWGSGEIESIVRAAESLASDRVRFVIVGGREDHVALWRAEMVRRHMDNVEFVGFVAPSDVAPFQIAANVLLLYYQSGIRLNDYRSPGKLFEYMAAGTPAVVADYPSIREVIQDEVNGLIVPPDRPDLLGDTIRRILGDRELAARVSEQARTDVLSYTWAHTAAATISLVERLWSD